MKNKTFLRRNTGEYSRLGKKRKKLQRWRRPKGRDNKMRLKEKGKPRVVEIGYKKSEKERKKTVVVRNLEELKALNKTQEVVIGKIGKKKRLEIAKFAEGKDLKISNLNIGNVLKEEKDRLEKKKKPVKKAESANTKTQKDKPAEKKGDSSDSKPETKKEDKK